MKKLLKILLILLLVVVVAFGGLLGFLTFTEYKPADVEALEIEAHSGAENISANRISVLSWNIGYAGLGKEQDFFMDGGTKARPDSRETVDGYLKGIATEIEKADADVVIL